MVDNFGAALHAIERLKAEGVVAEYALGGAMALVFWSEPIATFDIDVFVLLRSHGVLVSLAPVYEWARKHGYPAEAEHILIGGIPVQVIPAPDELSEEAITQAAELDYEGQPVRVIRPEFLIAMYLQPGARSAKRLERVAALLEGGNVDRELLDSLLQRYNLRLPSYE
jgi:hypothetical protein